ncbi:15429_t:CDS:2, partial [Gigaspora margarita]
MGHKDHISNLIKEATEDFGKISSIKPMVYEGTPVYSYMGPKSYTRVERSPKICFYCDKEGHIKRECEELRKLIEYRQRQKERRLQVIMQTQVQNQTKIMESVTYSANNPYITEATQNGNIEDNAKEQELICDEEENLLYIPESEKEEVVNEEKAKFRKEIEAEKVAQEYKKGDKMEIVVDTHVVSKPITDKDGFVQVINKKNKKKNSNAMMDKRLSPYNKDRIVKKSRASS